MKIEIWSDVVCPFCFIGKHRLEKAIEKFPEVNFHIEWKSFQLNPDEITDPNKNATEHLALSKGWTKEYTDEAHAHVCKMGESCDIDFSFNSVKVANSFDAHRLLHFAKTKGKQNELKELLFKAYFEEGKNIGEKNTLLAIAKNANLDAAEIISVLNGELFSAEVKSDLQEAYSLQIRGVPFFVFDRTYAISGAQPENVFEEIIQKMNAEK